MFEEASVSSIIVFVSTTEVRVIERFLSSEAPYTFGGHRTKVMKRLTYTMHYVESEEKFISWV